MSLRSADDTVLIDLALQGGGSHGAFTSQDSLVWPVCGMNISVKLRYFN